MDQSSSHELYDVSTKEYGATDVRLTPFYAEPDQAVYRVDRSNGPAWVLRHFSSERPYRDVEGDTQVLDFVRHLLVEQLVRTLDGRGSSNTRERGVIVTEFEAGPLAAPSLPVLRRIGATLGAVHQLEPTRAFGVLRRAASLPSEDLSLATRYLSEIVDDVPASQRAAYDLLEQGVATTSNCEDLPITVVHSDCHLVAQLADAVRFRPLVVAARAFQESIKNKAPQSAVGWWSRYSEAETVARRAAEYATEAPRRITQELSDG